jgi:hypothetical protein
MGAVWAFPPFPHPLYEVLREGGFGKWDNKRDDLLSSLRFNTSSDFLKPTLPEIYPDSVVICSDSGSHSASSWYRSRWAQVSSGMKRLVI